ncbi:MAG: 16S rRNA (uracil(1498)-N(3))-methyltransferase [Planctomycetes bacterium]|nr:16S rRNA (uracil(1498)-N(3))-methyltransferase [Planctomycetota bacterium]
MNFLLLHEAEVDASGRALLRGRRAEHVRTVLRAQPGQVLRAGRVDGPLGRATVRAIDAAGNVEVETEWHAPPPPTHDVLLLAVPRPKVLLRLFEHAAALGYRRLVLFRSWRVEKSHLQSSAMQPEVQREHLLAGLEQAGRTALPEVTFCPLFKPMVEDQLPGFGLPPTRFVAHPQATVRTSDLAALAGAPFALAIGPDGGFLPYEVDRLAELGFLPVSCGDHPLRTETAVAVLTGQLALLRDCITVRP